MSKVESYEHVWDAIADTAGESANMQAKAELMRQIVVIIKKNDWKQVEAAQHCGITQPRLNDMLRGRISRFSLDALVNIAAAIGQRVHIELEAA
jgi:predicted XRE-type DNA-binding protein